MSGSSATIQEEIQRLIGAVETLAALCVHLRRRVGAVELSSELANRVERVANLVADTSRLDATRAAELSGFIQAILGQSAAFVIDPNRPPVWNVEDPEVLNGLGRGSAALGPLIRDVVAPQLPGLVDRMAASPTILDVGVGVAALAIALLRCFPSSRVVGIDVWAPSLEIARANVLGASLADRVELRQQSVVDVDDIECFDLVWFSGPFVPGSLQTTALRACARALKRGGWLIYGAFGGGDPLSNALADLRTLRSGGPVLDDGQIGDLLAAASLEDVRPVRLDLGLPARIVASRRPL